MTSSTIRILRQTVLAASALLLCSGCGTDVEKNESAESPTGSGSVAATFEIRPVLGVVDGTDTPPVDPDGLVLEDVEPGGTFLDLGPAALDASAVRSASAITVDGDDEQWAVTVDFTDEGSKAFAQLSETAACEQGDASRVAVIVGEEVVSSPDVSVPCGSSISGSTQIGGDFDQTEAETLVRQITGD